MIVKNTLIIIVLCLSKVVIAQDSIQVKRDTIYSDQGWIEMILDIDVNENMRNGYFCRYDSLGTMVEQGQYKYLDSVECFECYNGDIMFPEEYMYNLSIKVGEWNYFNNNGSLRKKGNYSEKVRIVLYSYEAHDYFNLDIVALESGVWEYYNEIGNLVEKVIFKDGLKLEIIEY